MKYLFAFIALLSIGSSDAMLAYESDCNSGNGTKQLAKAIEQLSPWFKKLHLKITKNPNFKEAEKIVLMKSKPGRKFVFVLAIDKNGNLSKIRNVKHGLLTESDSQSSEILANLIRQCTPFNNPPNSLPLTHEVRIIFENKKDSIDMYLKLDGEKKTIAEIRLSGPTEIEFFSN